MAQINVTLTVVKEFFSSNPMYRSWDDMQINRIEFIVTDTGNGSIITVNVPLPAASSRVITTNVMLNQNTPYTVRTRAFSPLNPSGVSSTLVTFNTNDTRIFHDLMLYIQNTTNGAAIPNATLVFNPAGTGHNTLMPTITVQSNLYGLVWIQRIVAGTYGLTISAPLYSTHNITWDSSTVIGPTIGLNLL